MKSSEILKKLLDTYWEAPLRMLPSLFTRILLRSFDMQRSGAPENSTDKWSSGIVSSAKGM